MKTPKTLKISRFSKSMITTGVALALFAFVTIFAYAQSVPTVTTSIRNTSNAEVTTVPIGSVVYDAVSVASTTGPTPTGTVDFTLYPNTTCSGVGTVQAATPLVSGIASSTTTTVPNTGLSYKVHYNGQGDVYASADGVCETLVATAPNTLLSTTLSTTTPVLVGSLVYDTSVLSSATSNATGTVSYTVYTNNSCNTSFANLGTKIVAGAVVPNSDSLQFNTAGTYYFQAVYSGDQNNSRATSTCQSEVLNVVVISTPSPTNGSISGQVYNDLNRSKSKNVGEPGLPLFTINLYSGAGWWGNIAKSPIKTTTTDSSGNYAFGDLVPGTYSIEQIEKKPEWYQITGDYKSVVITGGASLTNYDFGNSTSSEKQVKKEKREDQKQDKKEKKEARDEQKFFKKFDKRFDHWKKVFQYWQKYNNNRDDD